VYFRAVTRYYIVPISMWQKPGDLFCGLLHSYWMANFRRKWVTKLMVWYFNQSHRCIFALSTLTVNIIDLLYVFIPVLLFLVSYCLLLYSNFEQINMMMMVVMR